MGEKADLQKSFSSANTMFVEERTLKEAAAIEVKGYKNTLDSLKTQMSLRDAEHDQQLNAVRNEMRKRFVFLYTSL